MESHQIATRSPRPAAGRAINIRWYTEKMEKLPLITLARATAKDIDTFLELERSVDGTPIYSAMIDRNEALAEIEKSIVYLIYENGRAVGSTMYEMKAPDHTYISGLVVHPDAQGRDIGRAAMIKILEELKNVPIIDLVTHPDNMRAIKLYESLGFSLGERIENYYGDGEPRVVMTLNHPEQNSTSH